MLKVLEGRGVLLLLLLLWAGWGWGGGVYGWGDGWFFDEGGPWCVCVCVCVCVCGLRGCRIESKYDEPEIPRSLISAILSSLLV